jgi:hypothetical protein
MFTENLTGYSDWLLRITNLHYRRLLNPQRDISQSIPDQRSENLTEIEDTNRRSLLSSMKLGSK